MMKVMLFLYNKFTSIHTSKKVYMLNELIDLCLIRDGFKECKYFYQIRDFSFYLECLYNISELV